jgi:hypothetical protein
MRSRHRGCVLKVSNLVQGRYNCTRIVCREGTRLSALGCRVGRHSNVIAPARPKITKESVGLGPEPREETGSSPTSLTPRSLTPRPHRATDGLWRTARAHRGPRMSRGRLGFASSTIVYGYKYAHVLTILENLGVQFVASQVPHPASRSIGDRTCVGRVDVESVVVRGRRELGGSELGAGLPASELM